MPTSSMSVRPLLAMWGSYRLAAILQLDIMSCMVLYEKTLHIITTYLHCPFMHMQQDVIGQNLADITYSECSSNITEGLKPSLIVSTSLVDECVVSQHKQFFVKLKPSFYSTSPSDCVS